MYVPKGEDPVRVNTYDGRLVPRRVYGLFIAYGTLFEIFERSAHEASEQNHTWPESRHVRRDHHHKQRDGRVLFACVVIESANRSSTGQRGMLDLTGVKQRQHNGWRHQRGHPHRHVHDQRRATPQDLLILLGVRANDDGGGHADVQVKLVDDRNSARVPTILELLVHVGSYY